MLIACHPQFQVVSKIESYMAITGAIALMISVTYSDDKEFKEILDYTIHRMIKEERPLGLQMDLTTDWLCPYPELEPAAHRLLLRNERVRAEFTVEKRACQFGYSKYIAMLLLIAECALFGLMYNIAKSEKSRLGRIGLARFVVDHVPIPLSANGPLDSTNATENSRCPIWDCPPSYEALLLDGNKLEVQMTPLSSDPNDIPHEKILHDDEPPSLPVLESTNSQSQLPSYELALLHEQGSKTL